MTTAIEAALVYSQQQQWGVFPLRPRDKKPLFPSAHEAGNPCKGECGKVGHGLHDATVDQNVIAEWWGQNPTAGIGIATGRKSGIFVLDIDAGHGGEETIASLLEKNGKLPDTPVQRTGGGGRHIVFVYPPVDIRNSAGRLGKGLDTRGEGGYICGAPTVHPTGNQYKWIDPPSKTKIAQAPDWLIRSLIDDVPITKSTNAGAYPTGQRNQALTSLAGTMRRRGMTEAAIYNALMVENTERCVPPLSNAEVQAIAASVCRYAPTAAPVMGSKDRAQAEYAFIKSVYHFPVFAMDFDYIKPEMFSDNRLAGFWADVISANDTTTAAAKNGLLAELDRFVEFDPARVDGYARQIQRFAKMDVVQRLGYRLQKDAEEGNEEKIQKTVQEIASGVVAKDTRVTSVIDAAEELEAEINRRSANPSDVWGIPYAWPYLSHLTGGKHKGELTISAGEPGVGKSWFWHQDAMETAIKEIPTLVWSGEMRAVQVLRRMYQLYGVDSRSMKTGKMSDDEWDKLRDAKSVLLNSPLYIDDKPLSLAEVRPLLARQKSEHGIEQAVFDYASLIKAPGKDEIEQSANVSRELKMLASDLQIAITLISSVNKSGMDTASDNVTKSNIRGSGQQIHDADNIFVLTKFNSKLNNDLGIMPIDYDRTIMLHFGKGRELEASLPGGFICYQRMTPSPKFRELKSEKDYSNVYRG